MKNSFIQSFISLLFSFYLVFLNDLFRNNDKLDETSPASNDDHVSDDTDRAKDEDINDEDNNLDKKNITISKNEYKKKKKN